MDGLTFCYCASMGVCLRSNLKENLGFQQKNSFIHECFWLIQITKLRPINLTIRAMGSHYSLNPIIQDFQHQIESPLLNREPTLNPESRRPIIILGKSDFDWRWISNRLQTYFQVQFYWKYWYYYLQDWITREKYYFCWCSWWYLNVASIWILW